MKQESAFEPTVLGAVWRNWRLVALIAAGALILGILLVRNQNAEYGAVATLVVEDPRATTVFESGAVGRPERYVNNQASILASEIVADRASEIARGEGEDLTPNQIANGLTINVFEESDEIGVSFLASEPDVAVVGANAVATAYEETRRQGISRVYDQALEQLDSSIAILDTRLAEISTEIAELTNANPSRPALEAQYQEALTELADLQASLAGASEEQKVVIRASLTDVRLQLTTLETVLDLEQSSPQISGLLAEQARVIERKEELRARRDEVEVDSSLESTGIVLFSPAIAASESASSSLQTIAAALILGLILGTAIAYRRAVSNRRFTERSQPELLLGVPLLTEVPDFEEEKVGLVPVWSDPASASAEAFRFVVPAINRAAAGSAGINDDVIRSFVVVSAAQGEGKTVVTANLALAAALQQSRVLVVDADFGDQQVTKLLSRGRADGPGLSDLSTGRLGPGDVIRPVEINGFPRFDIASRGQAQITAPEFFGSDAAKAFFKVIRSDYDIILIDAPPLLQVAYTSLLVGYADRSIVVVPHGSSVGRLEELTQRLSVMDAPALGYIYARAPLRFDLPRSQGSMRDVLGAGRTR